MMMTGYNLVSILVKLEEYLTRWLILVNRVFKKPESGYLVG